MDSLNYIQYLEIIGLFLNFFGSLILTIPLLNIREAFHEEEDKLIDLGITKDGEYIYTTKRRKRFVFWARLGAVFVVIGFLLQLIAKF